MLSDNRLFFAVTASVLLNVGCVAVVGEAAREYQIVRSPRSTASLHPAALQMAASRQEESGLDSESGQPGDGSADASGSSHKPGSGQSPGDDSDSAQANSSRARPSASRTGMEYTMHYRLSKSEAAAMNTADRLEKHLISGQTLSVSQAQTLGRVDQQLFQTAVQALTAQRVAPGQNPMPSAANSRMNFVTHPSVPSRNSHAGVPGNSIAPHMVKYPKMKLDLGTIHMTRPKYGITGGGRSDMRDVEITAHYIVDDPNNVPKTLRPNRLLKLFAANCNGDPGNTSHCLPTGGNTSLGGGTLHGKHDHITGVKYCIPGGGGIPGGGSSGSQSAQADAQSQQGRNALGKNTNGQNAGQSGHGKDSGPLVGPQQIISQGYQGHGPAFSPPMNGWHEGHLNPNETVAAIINPLHLPSSHGDFRGMVPGAKVPLADQRWVTDPQAHLAAALLGAQAIPLPRFTVSPRSIGSMSKFGTINWGRPVKIRHKKQPPGGDSSGLLGMYYRGTNFNQLVLSRPDRNIDYDWSAGPPDPRFSRSEEYSVRWEGKLVPKITDMYTLMTGSDDGVRQYLDDQLLISNWTVHSPSEDTAKVSLIAGHAYKIKVEYYENGYGYAAIRLYWESPHVPREYIPEQCLRYPRINAVR